MLSELLITLSLTGLICVFTLTSVFHFYPIDQTQMALILLQQKYLAINTESTTSFTIESYTQVETQISTNFDNCTLKWTKNATTSKSGTCTLNDTKLTLKVGEGGIGYP